MLFKIGDIGPSVVFKENLGFIHKQNEEQLLIELGVYLSLVISQGKGLNKEGLIGPIPWDQTPEKEMLVYSFLSKDPTVKDQRKGIHGTMHFLAIIHDHHEESFILSKLALKQELDGIFKTSSYQKSQKNIEEFFDYIRNVITLVVGSGQKILQERALDELLDNQHIQDVVIYTYNSNIKEIFKSESEILPTKSKIKNWQKRKSNIILSDLEKEQKFILIKYDKYSFYVSLRTDSISDAINVIKKMDICAKIIFSYL